GLAVAQREEILAELALQERQRVRARDAQDVTRHPPPAGARILHGAAAGAAVAAVWAAWLMRRAAGTAARRAAALLRHSSSSASGSLSATMPAPACTDARPSGIPTIVRIAIA